MSLDIAQTQQIPITPKITPKINDCPEVVNNTINAKLTAKCTVNIPRLYNESNGKMLNAIEGCEVNRIGGNIRGKRAVTLKQKNPPVVQKQNEGEDEGNEQESQSSSEENEDDEFGVKKKVLKKKGRKRQKLDKPKRAETPPSQRPSVSSQSDEEKKIEKKEEGMVQAKLFPQLQKPVVQQTVAQDPLMSINIPEIDRQIQLLLQLKHQHLQQVHITKQTEQVAEKPDIHEITIEELQDEQNQSSNNTQQSGEKDDDANNQLNSLTKKIDITNSGCKRKRKNLFKKVVYKNVDLEALNSYMTSDNFLVQEAKQVPGLVFQLPNIDVNFWRSQQQSKGQDERESEQPTQATKKGKKKSSKPIQLLAEGGDDELNVVDLKQAAKKDQSFLIQQQEFLEQNFKSLVAPTQQVIDLSKHFEPVTYQYNGGSCGKQFFTISISKTCIKDQKLLHWLKHKEEYLETQQLWEKELQEKQNKLEKRGKKGPTKKKPVARDSENPEVQEVVEKPTQTQSNKLQVQEADLKFLLSKQPSNKPPEYVTDVIKIEDGLIKYEYSNPFNLRVINHQFEYKQTLESYLNKQKVKAMQEQAKSRKKKNKVKSETSIKFEGFSVKEEQKGDEDDEVEICGTIDYEEEAIPDFTKVPDNILKNELQRNGLKSCQVKKSTMYQLLGEIWNYRKVCSVPNEYLAD